MNIRLAPAEAEIAHVEWLRHPITLEFLKYISQEIETSTNKAEAHRRELDKARFFLDTRYILRTLKESTITGSFLSHKTSTQNSTNQ